MGERVPVETSLAAIDAFSTRSRQQAQLQHQLQQQLQRQERQLQHVLSGTVDESSSEGTRRTGSLTLGDPPSRAGGRSGHGTGAGHGGPWACTEVG